MKYLFKYYKKIKVALIILVCLIFQIGNIFSQQNVQPEILTNYSVINMVKKGLGANIILLKIKQSNSNFDVSTEALVFLKDSKVQDEIIVLMIEKNTQNSNGNVAVQAIFNQNNTAQNINKSQPSNTLSKINNGNKKNSNEVQNIIDNLNGSGIYYFDEETKNYIPVDPTVVSGSEMKANVGAYFGMGSAVSKSFIDGKEANIQVRYTRRPIFYFYFDSSSTSLNNSNNKSGQVANNYMDQIYNYGNQKNSKAFTPNDFKFIQLDISRNSRYFKGGKIGLAGATSRISSGYFHTFKYDRLSPNLFKVYFVDDLDKVGQFCFLYAGNTSNNNGGFSNNKTEIKVFDFGTTWTKRK